MSFYFLSGLLIVFSYEAVTAPTQTSRGDPAPGALQAVAVHVPISQCISWVAGVLDVVSELPGSWILRIANVEGAMSRHRWVRAHRPADAQRQKPCGGGVHRRVLGSRPLSS